MHFRLTRDSRLRLQQRMARRQTWLLDTFLLRREIHVYLIRASVYVASSDLGVKGDNVVSLFCLLGVERALIGARIHFVDQVTF